jgi:hypothetical protein
MDGAVLSMDAAALSMNARLASMDAAALSINARFASMDAAALSMNGSVQSLRIHHAARHRATALQSESAILSRPAAAT